MNLRERRTAERLRELAEEGKRLAATERPSSVGPYIQDNVPLTAWRVRVDNIVSTAFGAASPHYRHITEAMAGHTEHSYEVLAIVGLLEGTLNDLEGGFLVGQEFLIAGEIFDSVLEQAKHLAENGFKDPAAVLGRVVLEDTLRRIAHPEGIDSTAKASTLNDALRDKGCYPKPQWRIIQAWLDIGNSAAHGKFDEYTQDDVVRMLNDVEQFLAQVLRQ